MASARARRVVACGVAAVAAAVAWAAWAGSRRAAKPADLGIPFANVAAAAGIRVQYGHPPGLLSILETAGSGAGFLDYDRDGKMDALLVGEDRCLLFRNNGNGTFSD